MPKRNLGKRGCTINIRDRAGGGGVEVMMLESNGDDVRA
jgi:hypothetical protein